MKVAKKERARAERRFNECAASPTHSCWSFTTRLRISRRDGRASVVIQRALQYLDSLAAESGNDLSLKSELAKAYQKVGLVTFDVAQAIESHRKATALNESLVAARPKKAAYRLQLSESYET